MAMAMALAMSPRAGLLGPWPLELLELLELPATASEVPIKIYSKLI